MEHRFYHRMKLIKCLLLIFLVFVCIPAFSQDNKNLSKKLENCLKSNWGIDNHTVGFINDKFKPLLDNPEHHATVKEFIKLSNEIKIDFSNQMLHALPKDDGIYASPKEHLVVFENPYIRVLYGSTEPGVREAFHSHQWESIMVIIKPTTYEIEYFDGKKETNLYPIGAYKLPAGEKYACKNVGSFPDECLRFEIKR